MTELLSGVNIGKVDFNGGHTRRRNRVSNRYTCVRKCAWIDNDNVKDPRRPLNPVNKFAFVICLAKVDFDSKSGRAISHADLYLPERRSPVNLGLTASEQVQVWTIEEQDFHVECIFAETPRGFSLDETH